MRNRHARKVLARKALKAIRNGDCRVAKVGKEYRLGAVVDGQLVTFAPRFSTEKQAKEHGYDSFGVQPKRLVKKEAVAA